LEDKAAAHGDGKEEGRKANDGFIQKTCAWSGNIGAVDAKNDSCPSER